MTIPEAQAHGQSVRKHLPRSHHHWSAKHRKLSAAQIIQVAMKGRIPSLLKLRAERIAQSPFAYLRGAVPVMAYDLGRQPHTGILCQLCGDAHVQNLGAYAAYDGNLIFDLNDFDETIRGPFEWDVKRMATSIIVAAREAGAKERQAADAAALFLRRYRKGMHLFAALPVIELARYQVHRLHELESVAAVFAKAQRSTPLHNLDTLTEPCEPSGSSSYARRFRATPPTLERLSAADASAVLAGFHAYTRTLQPERRHFLTAYHPVDFAFKVVGTGSVGLRDYVIYFEGNGATDPLFLQFKEEVPSAWAPYLPPTHSKHKNHGHRTVDGQRAMQLQSDPFLGYTVIEGRDYLVRQLDDHKAAIDFNTLGPAALNNYADLCGEILARGHARSGSPHQIAGYLGKTGRFDKAILRFATAYADQTETDWKAFVHSRRKEAAHA